MLDYLWLVPLLPLLGFTVLVFVPLPRLAAASVGVGSVSMAFLVVVLIAIEFLTSPPPGNYFSQTLWTWMQVGDFHPTFGLYLDGLTIVMLSVITGVGSLIHLYSSGYMWDDECMPRYFAYLNLFVCAMLMLVLADNLLLLFLGWEGVGLCSYLLIGFWYKDPENGLAARKAFVVTRVGDAFMAIGMFLLFANLGTINIQELVARATAEWAVGSGIAVAACLLLLGGAAGKSAQMPLQTWLPDAMAGPTPVSALIHAATMVTAGVYLIARTHGLYELAPVAQYAVAIVGLVTLLVAGFSALTQTDIKRILAYSTISQIGYMFFGLGVGAWAASISHLMTHAFFKALLFMTAGSVIFCLHHKQDIFEMGGLRTRMPVAFWSFVIGSACLAGFPLTSGFVSKDQILLGAFNSHEYLLFALGVLGALITAIYSFRLVFIVFFGEAKTEPDRTQTWNMASPLMVLWVFSLLGGMLVPLLPLDNVLPLGSHQIEHEGGHMMFTLAMGAVPIVGIAIAWFFFYKKPQAAQVFTTGLWGKLGDFWRSGWGFDKLYDTLFVNPFMALAEANRSDIVDSFNGGIAAL
ncbi:MAG: NADH-quinone oxidoreductase subunit L, partial [Halieaceae bacterium]|nr:NADH-quinone oxidoreductase subunit L [Halieaceae bacterium]